MGEAGDMGDAVFFFAVQIVFDLTRALLFSSAHQEKEKPERADARH